MMKQMKIAVLLAILLTALPLKAQQPAAPQSPEEAKEAAKKQAKLDKETAKLKKQLAKQEKKIAPILAAQKREAAELLDRQERCSKDFPALTADQCKSIALHNIWVGMTIQQVEEAWGKASDVSSVTTARGTSYTLTYQRAGGGWQAVVIDNGVVTSVMTF
jgi:hypothetical protein